MTSKSVVLDILASADIKIGGKRPQDITVHNPKFYARVLRDGELGLGESYVEGWWDAAAPDEVIAHLLEATISGRQKLTPRLVATVVAAKVMNQQTVSRARRDVGHHYNIGNDLYEAMLDPRMIYSCAYWKTAKNLAQAQTDKLDLICRKLHLKKGMTVLDIGCGWGGFAEYAAKTYGVKVTGISPAGEQVKLAKARTKGLNVKILQKDYREVTGKYDRIVSIGMLEHVGKKNYKTFFDTCNNLLATGGIMLHHTIGVMDDYDPAGARWIRKYIFPGTFLPNLADLNTAARGSMVIEDVQNLASDYDRTLLEWHKNFMKAYPKLDHSHYDARFKRMWEYYLFACAGSFRSHRLTLFQVVMRRYDRTGGTYLGVR